MANQDFFLNFGSNAGPFARKLSTEVRPATEAIQGLIDSLDEYEGTLGRARNQSTPLSSLFDRLDQATSQFSQLSGTLTSTFQSAMSGIRDLHDDLVSLVNEIRELPTATGKARQSIKMVSEEEAAAARSSKQTRPWTPGDLTKIIDDAREARNALKRVGDINSTVARNATTSADALQNLGKVIRELTQKTNVTTRQVTEGRLNVSGGNIVVVGGGGVQNLAGAASNVDLQQLLGALGGLAGKPSMVSAVSDAKATEIAEEAVSKIRNLTAEDLRGPAQRGRYTVLGSQSGRSVGFDVLPGESYEHYFSRHDYARERLEQIRSSLPAPDPQDLKLYNQFRQSGGKQADDVFERIIGGTHSTIEQVRASTQGLQLGALTKGQIDRLPETLLRIADIQRQQDAIARRGIHGLLQDVPDASFQGAYYPNAESRRGRVPTTGVVNADVEIGNVIGRAIHAVDEQIRSGEFHVPGARRNLAFREEARESAAAFRPIFSRDASVVDDRLLVPYDDKGRRIENLSARTTRAKKLQEEAQREYDQAVGADRESAALRLQTANANLDALRAEASAKRKEVTEKRQLRQAAVQDILAEPKTPEQARAAAERDPEVAALSSRINRLRESRTAASDTELAKILGLSTQGTDISPTNEGIAALQRGASASGLRRILDTHPSVVIQKLLAEQERDAERFTGIPGITGQAGLAAAKSAELLRGPGAGAEAERILREREAEARTHFEESQKRTSVDLTDEQRAEGIARLEAQREELIQQGISRLTAANAITTAPTPAPTAAETREGVAPARPARADTSDRRAVLDAQRSALLAQRADLKAQIDQAGGFKTKFDDEGAQAAFDQLRRDFNALRDALRPVNKELHQLNNEAQNAARAEARQAKTASAGGGGTRPPRPPAPPTGGGGDDGGDGEEPPTGATPPRGARSSRRSSTLGDFSALIAQLDQTTRAALETARNTHGITEQTKTLTAQQREALVTAGRAFQEDPAYSRFPNQETRYKTFAEALGLPSVKFAQQTLSRSGLIAQAANVSGGPTREDAERASIYATTLGQVAGESARVRAALLREAVAQEQLNRLRASGTATDFQMLRAEAALASAQRSVLSARLADANEPGGSLGKRLFGQRGFIEGQLRHLGQAIENIAGYTLVFSGFQKLQQLVDDGIQADVTFVRLQASLNAAGRATGALRTQLQGVSSATGQYLPDVVNAAAELAGVFHNNADLVEGTRVVAELSNISQGTLDAKEAAIGLRDVTDAYGISGVDRIRAVGDEIARLSQTTGVSVKDVLESTTELAQEAHFLSPHDPRAAQRQAAVLGAYVTRATGETGESAAEQVSRIISTLNNGKVQDLLTSIRIPERDKRGQLTGKPGAFLATREQFASGEIGQVLTNLLANFDKLTPSSQQAVFSLVGAGRQARAFAGLIRDAAAAADELSNAQGDEGALAQQNARYLATLGGQIKLVGNEFRNLGATLQQLGVFDLIGALAKGMYGLLKAFNEVFGGIGRLANSNSITKTFEHLIVILGEASLAMKVFGGVAGNILGSAGLRTASRFEEVNGVRRAVYDPITFGGAMQGLNNMPGRVATRVRASAARLFQPSDAAYLAQMGIDPLANPAAEAEAGRLLSQSGRERFAQQVANRTPGPVAAAAAERGFTRTADAMNKAAVAAGNAATNIGTGLSNGLTRLRSSAVMSTAAVIGLGLVLEGIFQALESHHQTGKRVADLGDQLSGADEAEAEAQRSGKTTHRTPAQQLAYDARNPSILEHIGNMFHGEVGSDPDQYTTFGWKAKALTIASPFVGGLIARNFMQSHESTGFGDQMDFLQSNLQKQLDNSMGSVKALKRVDEINANTWNDYKGIIDDMGLNQAQKAQAYAVLDRIKNGFEAQLESLKLQARGISDIDQLNGVQLQNLTNVLQQAQGMSSETLRKFPGLVNAMLQNSGVPEGTQGYRDMQAAFGENVTPLPMGIRRDSTGAVDPNGPQYVTSGPGQTGFYDRARSQLRALNHALRQVSIRMQDYTASDLSDPNNKNAQADLALSQSLPQQIQALQTTIRGRAQQFLALSAIAEASGFDDRAVSDLRRANNVLQHANHAINDVNDPQYIENLKQIQDNKTKIAELQHSHALQALEIAQAGAVSPLEKANLAYAQAVEAEAAVRDRPHHGSRQARADAHAQSVAAALANTQASLEEGYSATEAAIARLTSQGNPAADVRAARLGEAEARQKVDDYINVLGGVKGDTTYNQLMAQVFAAEKNTLDKMLAERLATISVLIGDTTDPVDQAETALRKARAQARFDRRNNIGDPRADHLAVQEAQDARQKARFDQRLGDEQTAYDLHQQSAASFLRFLNRQDHLLRTQIKGMKKGEEGYRQRVDELNQIDKQIQDVTNAASGQFNLGDITLPTYYQVRRMATGGASSMVTNDHSSHVIHTTINGADFAKVKAYLNEILGPRAQNTRSHHTKRKVGA